jgi:hypothetical protein
VDISREQPIDELGLVYVRQLRQRIGDRYRVPVESWRRHDAKVLVDVHDLRRERLVQHVLRAVLKHGQGFDDRRLSAAGVAVKDVPRHTPDRQGKRNRCERLGRQEP